ncbi:Chromosome transmission fidelity protein 18 [Galemys pyrenaicus]|uniref:Chromosome transmission fidelity protein 18 homolog n=1 Tax=Galemys pyrenaicus TaxID=202257 RepID=A0A8J6A6Y6_GALPY|nr:Chromosome transmission fidelity protein 18 [Galemys pyrenaicus]
MAERARDDFRSQFAAELEVLAELEGTAASPPAGIPGAAQRPPGPTSAAAPASGDAVPRRAPGALAGARKDTAGKRPLATEDQGAAALPSSTCAGRAGPGAGPAGRGFWSASVSPAPRLKRSRLEVVRALSFGPDEVEEPLSPEPPSPGITPTMSPEVPAELWAEGCVAWVAGSGLEGAQRAGAVQGLPRASPATRNPVLKRLPILEDYVSVTSTGGDRAFLLLRADPVGTGVQSPFPAVRWRGRGQLDLLGVSFASLKEQVDSQCRQQWLEQVRLEEPEDVLARHSPEAAPAVEPAGQDGTEHWLWVDEFAPRRYTELLSDDFTNRCLLKWLKLWDPVVFGRGRPARRPRPSLEPAWGAREAPATGKWKSREQVLEEMLEAELDASQRPRQKVSPALQQAGVWVGAPRGLVPLQPDLSQLAGGSACSPLGLQVALLCGPPGLGKTTLAHVIARHAGYCVVEMNASDDRSPEAFRARVEAATQMESVLGAGGKPNCLVIDEIDGAPTVGLPGRRDSGAGGVGRGGRGLTGGLRVPQAAINVLLGILDRKGPQEAESGAPSGPAGGGRRRRAEGRLLMRPVICICNDQFAPALRQLKQQAFLLLFPPTLASRLMQRLQEISLRRGIQADPGALAALCEKADNDIRACINTLQFLHRRGQRDLSVQAVQATHVGLKDQRKGLFSVWQDVFQLPRAQRRQDAAPPAHSFALGDAHPGPHGAQTPLTMASQRFLHVLHVAASAGEHEKVVQGLFDNFLRLRLRESSLGAVCAALDWLAFDDLLQRAALQGQRFQLLRYQPFLPAAFHVLFAASRVPRLAFPSSQQEAQSRRSRTQNLIQTLVSGIAPATRSRAAPQALVLDALCLLLDILAPKLRPVSTQLYSAREKEQLASLVGTMLAYSLTYRQERSPDGQYVYRLEPDVEEVCRFPELPARKPLTYQAKQLIAREIEVEKMRRAEAAAGRRLRPQVAGGPPGAEDPQGGSGDKGAGSPARCGPEQLLRPVLKRAALEEQPERDFFGRAVARSAAAPSTEDAAPETQAAERRMGAAVGRSDVWFRFKEGVSNAVRRGLYIRDLL